jgi:4-hydroxyphenylpyruvate dioxygenase
MGPFPHDAPPATISAQNPMGTDGFAFVEFAHPERAQLHALFRLMGFSAVASIAPKRSPSIGKVMSTIS